MKKDNILINIILPISVAVTLLISFIIIKDKIEYRNDLESCEKYSIDIISLLPFFIVLIAIISCYELFIGNKIKSKIHNKFIGNTINTFSFASIFTLILIIINLTQTKKRIEWDFFVIIYPALLIFGIYLTFIMYVIRKLLK